MIVEFVGSTGAGKTTLACEVYRRLAKQTDVATSFELVAGWVGLRRVTNPTLRNLVQDIVGLPFFFGALVQHRAFVAYALKTVARQSNSFFLTANYMRSIVRKIGMYEIGQRYTHDRIILVDEGTVLSAHLLFVFGRKLISQEEIERFASLVPLPDLVVYVKAPVDSMVQRSLRRSDAPREMRSKDQMEIEETINRAAKMFDQLSEANEIRERVLVVDNPASTENERRVVAERIATFILNYESAGQQVPTRPAGRIEPGTVIGEHRVG